MAVAITRPGADIAGVAASGNVASYTSVDIGVATSDRIVVVCIGNELASSAVTGVTINVGDGAVAMIHAQSGALGAVFSDIYYRVVQTGSGAVATVNVTFGGTNPTGVQNHIAVYRVVGAATTPTGSGQVGDSDADPISSGAITIPASGGCIAICSDAASGVRTWGGITEDLDVDTTTFQFGTGTSVTGGTPTITVSGANGEDGAISWILFGPAVINAPIARNFAKTLVAALIAWNPLPDPLPTLGYHHGVRAEAAAQPFVPDNPPFASPGRDVVFGPILSSWQLQDIPQQPRRNRLVQAAVAAPQIDQPPYGLLETYPDPFFQYDPGLPQLGRKLVWAPAAPVADNPPFSAPDAWPGIYSWPQPDPLPTLGRKLLPAYSDPPFGKRAAPIDWPSDLPLPTLGRKLVQEAAPAVVINDPPFGKRAALADWQADPPLPTLGRKLVQEFTAPAVINDPPFGSEGRDAVYGPIILEWQPPHWLPPVPNKLVQEAAFVPPVAGDNPPFGLLETYPDPFFDPPDYPAPPLKKLIQAAPDEPPGAPFSDIVVIAQERWLPILPRKLGALLGSVVFVPDNPPFGHAGRRAYLVNLATAWEPIPPLPQLGTRRILRDAPSFVPDNPPLRTSGDWLVQWWTQPDPLPTLGRKLVQPFVPDNPPFTKRVNRLDWPEDPAQPTLGRKSVPAPVFVADNPPSRTPGNYLVHWWIQPDPLPQLGYRKTIREAPPAVINDPPFSERQSYLVNLLVAWEPPPPLPTLAGKVNPDLLGPPVIPPVVIEPPAPSPGGGLPFPRKKWRELLALIEAERTAEIKADELKRSVARQTLRKAVKATEEIVQGIQSGEGMPEIERLTKLLNSAANADRLADVLSKAKQAVREANRIKDEMDEEEEAMVFLLLH